MILQLTDFNDRPYKIPNQNESRDLESWIEAKENELLKLILGYELWKEFTEALDGSGELEQKWIDLRDGAEYEYGGKTYKYNGLVDLLRPAIYALWVPEGTWKFTNSGYVQNEQTPDNSVTLNTSDEFQAVRWNEFVSKCNGFCLSQCNTFYGFMKADEALAEPNYPDWDFTAQKFKNRYGL